MYSLQQCFLCFREKKSRKFFCCSNKSREIFLCSFLQAAPNSDCCPHLQRGALASRLISFQKNTDHGAPRDNFGNYFLCSRAPLTRVCDGLVLALLIVTHSHTECSMDSDFSWNSSQHRILS
jgi:hypothetical protein